MADTNDSNEPVLRGDKHRQADKYASKFVDKTEKYQNKIHDTKGESSEKKGPAGGYDATPFAQAPPGYTLKITFHRAENLPFADVPTFSSDPYIIAVLNTDLAKRHKQDPDLTLRTPTVHRNVNPTWDTVWTVAHVPASGFHMKCRLYDEDPSDHDDRLGNVHVDVDRIDESWQGFRDRAFPVKKRMGSKRAYTLRGCAALVSKRVKMDGKVYITVENLGRSEGNGGRAYTISPLPWSQHYSPLIGLIAGTKNLREAKNGKKSTERYNFQAIQMQFQGPVPEHLYHRYVEFRPFVAGMFTSHSLRGRILNHALHHQHARIYNYDSSTKYGHFDKPCSDMTQKFLEFVNYDQGGRIYTYVMTLDGQIRFTETGKEFGIDLLSKHTMHSDVSIYIAFSGEFFIRRLKHPHKDKSASPDPETEALPPRPEVEEEIETNANGEKPHEHDSAPRENHDTLEPPRDQHSSGHDSSTQVASPSHERKSCSSWRHRSHSGTSSANSPAQHADATHAAEEPSKDPSYYELIIDNDSGTYRPNAKYLGQLKTFLQHNLPGLRIVTLDCQKDADKMGKLKNEQRERKKSSGKQVMYMQNLSNSSISSSDEEDLERRTNGEEDATNAGMMKSQWNKVKNFGKGGDDDDDLTPDAAAPDVSRSEKPEMEKAQAEKSHAAKKASTSTGEKASFDTASEHGDRHYVTPKPSLGHGGLNAFDQEDRPLSRGIDEELEKRGLERLSLDKQEPNSDKKINGHPISPAGQGGVHQAVTNTA